MTLYTDIENFCCEVLRTRVADGGLPPGDVWERDVCTLTAEELAPYTQVHLFCGIGGSPLGLKWAGWPAELSIVTGGFPCVDVSDAGDRAGISAPRSGLYREVVRCLRLVPRAFGLLENVAALLHRGLGTLLGDMASIGRDAEWDCLSARDVGLCHRRRRVWIVVHPMREGHEGAERSWFQGSQTGSEGRRPDYQPARPVLLRDWPPRPDEVSKIPRMADGIPGGVVSPAVKALGNAQAPACVELIARSILNGRAA